MVACKDYFCKFSETEYAILRGLIGQLTHNATPAYLENVHNGFEQYVLIPVAIAQEKKLFDTLMLYTRQQHAPRFCLLLSCNWIVGADERMLEEGMQQILQFQRLHPEIASTYYKIEYPKSVTMGRIQGHQSDVAAMLASKATFVRDSHQISHAADIESLHPRYLSRVYSSFTQRNRSIRWVTSLTRHAERVMTPNMNRLIAWYDFRMAHKGGYELGMAVSTASYCKAGGIDYARVSMAWTDLRDRVGIASLPDLDWVEFLARNYAEVSPRRLQHRLAQEGAELHRMWESGIFETQVAHHRQVYDIEDVNDRTFELLLTEFLESHGDGLYEILLDYYDDATEAWNALYRLAKTPLERRVLQASRLSELDYSVG